MAYLSKHIKKISSSINAREGCDVNLVDEHVLKLYHKGKLLHEFICINSNLNEIVIGWLVCKAYIKSVDEINTLSFDNDNHVVYVDFNKRQENNNQFNSHNVAYEDKWIFDLVNAFQEGTSVHKLTSGTHCCILSIKGKITIVREDIGRHNAIDKVVGYIYLNNISQQDCIIFSSGRVSSDVVKKLINAKIPVLVSKSVTSYQAADIAKGKLTLICRAWPDSFEIYS